MKASICTLGCKTNQAESILIEGGLRAHGVNIVELSEGPEICIINTCTVTSKSDYESRQLMRKAQKAGARVIVTGCYSDLNRGAIKDMGGDYEVISNINKLHVINKLTNKQTEIASCIPMMPKSRFFLKAQEGCNYACSYCLIPMARGKSKSIEINCLIEQAAEAARYYNEIIITGIHLGTYGYDLNPKITLADLVESILKKTDIKRIRLSSLEVREIDNRLMDLLSDERICRHLHIPLQSGDEKILRLMNRSYNLREFVKGIEAIYEAFPEIAIGTDIIAGFPGEGEEEFSNTYKLIESIPFAYVHVFPFSDRPGTGAEKMRPQTAPEVKKERCARLRALGHKKKGVYMLQQIGKSLDLLIEDKSEDDCCTGITGNYLKLSVAHPDARVKDVVFVKVAGVSDDTLTGSLIGIR